MYLRPQKESKNIYEEALTTIQFVYSFQGQFTINPANQGISTFSWQTTTNVIGFVSSLIAAALYGNIGIKVLYQNVIRDLLGVPDLNSKTGKLLWVGMVPVYWSLAFIIASAIPQFSNIGSLVAAVCILQLYNTRASVPSMDSL